MKYRLFAKVKDEIFVLDLELEKPMRKEHPELFDVYGLPDDVDSIIVEQNDPRIEQHNHIAYQKFGKMFKCESEKDFEFKGYITDPLITEMDNGDEFKGGNLWTLKKTQV